MLNYFTSKSVKQGNIIKCVSFALLLVMCLLLFSGCGNEQKVLYRSNSVEVIREGNKTAVYDLLTDNEYNYKTMRVKRSDGVVEAYTAVDTDTIKIEVLPSATLRIYEKSADKIITIRR
jgi:hypothetical protein